MNELTPEVLAEGRKLLAEHVEQRRIEGLAAIGYTVTDWQAFLVTYGDALLDAAESYADEHDIARELAREVLVVDAERDRLSAVIRPTMDDVELLMSSAWARLTENEQAMGQVILDRLRDVRAERGDNDGD